MDSTPEPKFWFLLKEEKEVTYPGSNKTQILPRGSIVFSMAKLKGKGKYSIVYCLDKPDTYITTYKDKLEEIDKDRVEILKDKAEEERFDILQQNTNMASISETESDTHMEVDEEDEFNVSLQAFRKKIYESQRTAEDMIQLKQAVRKYWVEVISSPIGDLKFLIKKGNMFSEETLRLIKNSKNELEESRIYLGQLLKTDHETLLKHEAVVNTLNDIITKSQPKHDQEKEDDSFDYEFMVIKTDMENCKRRLLTYERDISYVVDSSQIADILFSWNVISCQEMLSIATAVGNDIKFEILLKIIGKMKEDEKLAQCLKCFKKCTPEVYRMIANVPEASPEKKLRSKSNVKSDKEKNKTRKRDTSESPKHNVEAHTSVEESRPKRAKKEPCKAAVEEKATQFSIGSMVEVKVKGKKTPLPGVIRWIDTVKGEARPIAGLEMENITPYGAWGTINGTVPFKCPRYKSLFAFLDQCVPDSRFEPQDDVNSTVDPIGWTESIKGDHPAISNMEIIGKEKGIQGHYNSCYLDATMFAMFAFNQTFDYLLNEMPTDKIDLQDDIRLLIKERIVNPLRCNYKVGSDSIMELRRLLDKLSTVRGLMFNEKDPEEFLAALVQHTLEKDGFIQFNEGGDSYIYTMTSEKDGQVIPTVQKLLNSSFMESNIQLKQVPDNMLIQIPRSGKHFKMYDMVFPNPTLCLQDIVENVCKECLVCNDVATVECKQCRGELFSTSGRVHAIFCDACSKQRHSHASRKRHKPAKLKVPTKSRSKNQPDETEMQLYAVLCIETSHYVCFSKTGADPDKPWVLFDSMADRTGGREGINIPEVYLLEDLNDWLTEDGRKTVIGDVKQLPRHVKRLFSDAYLCFYRKINT